MADLEDFCCDVSKNTKPIYVFGDVMLDVDHDGKSTRLSPEAPVPVFVNSVTTKTLGGAGNVAANLKKLGHKVNLSSIIGDDDAGDVVLSLLNDLRINASRIVKYDTVTTVKERYRVSNHQLMRVDSERILSKTIVDSKSDILWSGIEQSEVCVISDYSKGMVNDICRIIKQHKGVKFLVDPKSLEFSDYAGSFLVKPNWKELNQLIGKCDSIQDATIKLPSIMQQYDIQNVLVTMADDGMMLIQKDGKCEHFPVPRKSNVFDVTGAGDTVIASIASAISDGFSLKSSIKIANKAAAFVIAQKGTATVSREQLWQLEESQR